MTEFLPAWPLLAAFLAASLVLAVTPGPAVFYILTRTLAQGRTAGLASVLGVAAGNFGNALAASIGLAALFAVSAMAFTVVKYAGAAYLVYLGLKAFKAPASQTVETRPAPVHLHAIFRDGFVVALLNPKTAIFFAAFLPQFMNPEGSAIVQSTVLGFLFVLIAGCTDIAYVLTASAVAPALAGMSGARAAGRYLTAGAFIGLGLFTALSGSRNAK